MKSRILVIDDDMNITSFLKRALSYEGYSVETAASGAEGLTRALTEPPDLVVLDVMMPGLDGYEVAKRLRAGGPQAILMLTARDAVADRVQGLDSGADDYLVKPFALEELLARVRALLRRGEPATRNRLQFADLSVDLDSHEVRRGSRTVELTSTEFELLVALLRNPRPGEGPRRAVGKRVGHGPDHRHSCGRSLHRLPAAKAGIRRGSPPDPDGARGRLCAAGVGGMTIRPLDVPANRLPLATCEMLPVEPAPLTATPLVTEGPITAEVAPAGAAPTAPRVRRARPLRLPIRARLAVWYSLLLAFVLVLFSTLLYTTVTSNLSNSLDASLQERATIVAQQSKPVFDRGKLGIQLPRSADLSDIFVQVTDPDGNIMDASANLDTIQLPMTEQALAVAAGGKARYETVPLGGQDVRVYYAILVLGGQRIGLIQVARSLKAANETTADLARQLAVGSGLALLAALGLGWLISGQALHPLERIGRTAAAIGLERDFSRRVPYAGPNDEVGRLAAGFNTMLDRLQGAYADEQDAARRLEAALAAQHRFVADASHELRTPLTAIRGNAELLQRIPDMAASDRSDSIAQIAAESQRMSRLVGDLLTLARADAGGELHNTPVAVGPLVESAVAAARHLGQATLVVRDPLPAATINGDADRLKQLLLILLDNALKYTPPTGQVTVQVTQQGTDIAMSVEDSGVGIAAADLPHIFERFYRADPARTAGGTGLGLAIAGWIVQAHGGRIHVVSTPGVGSVFTVLLPVAGDQFLPDSELTLHSL